jgi:hypothetical protein
MDQRYQDGSEIHVGGVVSYNNQRGTIVFVADRNEYSESHPESNWPQSSNPTGFMIQFTNGALLFLDSSDEHLELITRKQRRWSSHTSIRRNCTNGTTDCDDGELHAERKDCRT